MAAPFPYRGGMSPHRRRVVVAGVAAVAITVMAATFAMAALRAEQPTTGPDDPVRVVPVLALPDPRTDGPVSLEQAIEQRGTVRAFADEPLSTAQLGQLLWAAQGLRGDELGGRTVPSAGALYPLELYVVQADGVWHYRPQGHEIVLVDDRDVREALARAALDQRAFHTAPAVVAIAGVEQRSARKYGARAERYVAIEAGHAAQNLLLQATVLGLGAVPTGAFDDDAVAALLSLPDASAPLYLIPTGPPETTS